MSTVPELDILVASILWLHERGAKPLCASIAKGSEAGRYADHQRFREALQQAGLEPCSLATDGPDIIAASESECWQVECKGAGSGVQATQRNNFDRALASVVSYYGNLPRYMTERCTGAPILGLALPASSVYVRELRRRVSGSLRQVLNMWILLYEPATQHIRAVAPRDDYPSQLATQES
jgi:hypothetical protein